MPAFFDFSCVSGADIASASGNAKSKYHAFSNSSAEGVAGFSETSDS
jgi:hypothetical protein